MVIYYLFFFLINCELFNLKNIFKSMFIIVKLKPVAKNYCSYFFKQVLAVKPDINESRNK